MSLVTLLLAASIILLGLVVVTTLGNVAAWVAIALAVVAVVLDLADKDRHVGGR